MAKKDDDIGATNEWLNSMNTQRHFVLPDALFVKIFSLTTDETSTAWNDISAKILNFRSIFIAFFVDFFPLAQRELENQT